MAYRGEDLDLRTPQTWSGSPPEVTNSPEPYTNGARTKASSYGRAAPILVDEVVLACSNHAFDVAVAHRAGEVRLEHLLHAMTRIDGASNALEARGIRVPGLRRESATIIASEIPIGLGTGQVRPHRSDDFEQALRTASAIAYRRNAPANVDDLLDAMLDMPSDISGIALLARHGGRVARDRPPQREMVREREPMREREPVRTREVPREREPMREFQPLPPLTRASASYAQPAYTQPAYAPEPRMSESRKPQADYYASEPSRPMRSDLVGTQVDSIQNARIDQLENALRALATDLANDRSVQREDTSRFHGGLHDRLQSLEQSVLASGKDDGDAAMLLDRLASVERGLEQRLGELSRPWGVLSDRLQGLEQTILDTRSTKGGDSSIIVDRLSGLERTLSKGLDLGPIANRLDIIEEAVLSPASSPDSSKLAERLRTLEDAINGQRAVVMQSNQAVMGDIKSLASALANQSAGNERVQSFVSDRIQTLTSGFERQRAELTAPILDRVTALTGVIENRGTDSQRTLSVLAERMASLESNLATQAAQAAEVQAAHTAELKEVHEALIKLNTNQHTLAGSIDQWRLDGVGDISVIANRLEGIEKSTAKPVAMMEALTTSVDNINRVTVERYHRRNRFWYWLFGTDDWLTASWPSQVASVEAERATLRGSVPKVVPMQAPPSKSAQR